VEAHATRCTGSTVGAAGGAKDYRILVSVSATARLTRWRWVGGTTHVAFLLLRKARTAA